MWDPHVKKKMNDPGGATWENIKIKKTGILVLYTRQN